MDSETIAQLKILAIAAREAADRFMPADEAGAVVAYERLRSSAWTLNRAEGWAEPEDFDTLFPTMQGQRQIESLDDQYGIDPSRPREPGAPVQRLLRHLSAWATGLLVAKNLDHEAGT